MCVSLSLSVFSAVEFERAGEYLTVSAVCVCASFVVCDSEETVSSSTI